MLYRSAKEFRLHQAKKKRRPIVVIALAAVIVLFVAAFSQAGPREQVAVAEAFVWASQNQRPQGESDNFGGGKQAGWSSAAPANPFDASCLVWTEDAKSGHQGSGTVIVGGASSLVLTCEHVFRDMVNPKITVRIGGKAYNATLLRADAQSDLALCRVDAVLPYVNVAKRIPADGSDVVSIGMSQPVPTKIVCLDTHDKPAAFWCSSAEIPGRSGGGLFFGNELIGVIKAVRFDQKMSMYVALDPIHEFLGAEAAPPTPIESPSPSGEMRIVPLAQSGSDTQQTTRRKVYYYTAEKFHGKRWCQKCNVMKPIYGTGNDSVEMVYLEDCPPLRDHEWPGVYPALFVIGDDKKWTYPVDEQGKYWVPETLDKLADWVQRNSPAQSFSASGPAGAIHASSQIRTAISTFRQYIGDGKSASGKLSRNGAAFVSLFAMKDWDIKQILGSDGRVEMNWPDAINMPTKEFAFGYRLRGSDVIVDPDPFMLPGALSKLKFNQGPSQIGPYGIIGIDDALFALSVISIIRDVAALLRPSCDLMLPGELSATATLNGDTLNVTFDKPATVRLVWLFTFNLQIKSVAITERNIHVDFSGSRWVKSRDFEVK